MGLELKQRFNLSRFIKGEKVRLKQIVLNHQRIFILPTKRGLGFVVLITLLLLIAFIYNNNLAYLLSFLLASIFFITILHSFKSLAGLVLTQGQSQAVFAGESTGFEIVIDNPNKIERYNLQASLDKHLDFTLAEQEKKRIILYSATSRRGWHDIETVTLSSTYPLGLFRAWSPLRFSAKALVYPKPSAIERDFPEAEGNNAQALQNSLSHKGSDDFYGLKEYQKGDSIKHIHWKAFAKGQGLFSKQYAGDNLTELWLNYEQTPGHNVEERLSQLCRWVIDAEKLGLRYGFSVPGIKLKPNHGQVHYEKCLQALALY
ncbi:MAG: DUF58 domain-containing protein [Methylococcales bacterium]|nr:DUF58 domain-containing protein [Methylococcales bacterium]